MGKKLPWSWMGGDKAECLGDVAVIQEVRDEVDRDVDGDEGQCGCGNTSAIVVGARWYE